MKKEEKGERLTHWKLNSFTNNTDNKRNNAKYTKPILRFPYLGAPRAGIVPAAAKQAPESPGLDSAVDRNWTWGCRDRNMDQECTQDNKQGPLQNPAMDEEGETLVIPQL